MAQLQVEAEGVTRAASERVWSLLEDARPHARVGAVGCQRLRARG